MIIYDYVAKVDDMLDTALNMLTPAEYARLLDLLLTLISERMED